MSIKRNSLWILLIAIFLSSCIAPRNPLEGIDIPEPNEPDLIYYFTRGCSSVFFKRSEKLQQARQDLEKVIELDQQIQYPEAYPFLVECYQQLEIPDSAAWIYPNAFSKLDQHTALSKKYTDLFQEWQSNYPNFPEKFLEKEYSLFDATPEPIGGMERFYGILEYPEMAKNMNRSGITWVSFIIEADASMTNLHLLKSSYSDLDEAAFEALNRTSWIPAKYRDRPVPYQIIMPIMFR